MDLSRTYPEGVPSWVDTEQSDLDEAQRFYGELFGWTFKVATPADAPDPYVVAQLDGRDVGGLAGSTRAGTAQWNTYIAVDDADQMAARVNATGGRVVTEPADAGEGGRYAICADPSGVTFRLWQARRRPGAQVVNVPGSWNFSDLHTDDTSVVAFYTGLFGWAVDALGFTSMVRRPGYGDHLAATADPDIRERQRGAGAPPGFEDAIGWVNPVEPEMAPHWQVSFTVADRDATATTEQLGAEVLSTAATEWTRTALLRDPQGAVFTASQFTPPS